MTTAVRDELMDTVSRLSELCPELRFGQMIANLATLARGIGSEAIWDAEDNQLLAVAKKQVEFFENRVAEVV